MLCRDIYHPAIRDSTCIAARYARPDNALYILESATGGEANAMNAMRTIADYNAIGICGFSAKRTLTDDAQTMMHTRRAIKNLSPLLIRYRGTGQVHAIVLDEFAKDQYIKLEHFHVHATFLRNNNGRVPTTQFSVQQKEFAHHAQERGRALLVEENEFEYFLAGAGGGGWFLPAS